MRLLIITAVPRAKTNTEASMSFTLVSILVMVVLEHYYSSSTSLSNYTSINGINTSKYFSYGCVGTLLQQ